MRQSVDRCNHQTRRKEGNYRTKLIKTNFSMGKSGTNILFNRFIVIMFMTLYYKERTIIISLDFDIQWNVIFPPIRSTSSRSEQHETCIHSGANHHYNNMPVLDTSTYFSILLVLSWILSCALLFRKEKEIGHSRPPI